MRARGAGMRPSHVSSWQLFLDLREWEKPVLVVMHTAMHLFEYRSVRSWSNEIDTTLSGGQKN